MPISPMTWDDLEKVVADSVYAHFASLDQTETENDQTEREKFCRDVKRAHSQLLKTYDLPRIGEAYALWHHMMRANEICVALDIAKMFGPLKYHVGEFRVADIGSGTGAGVMAIVHWFVKTYPNRQVNLRIDRVEPSRQMRDTASYILKAYRQKLEDSFAENVRPVISAPHDPATISLSQYASTVNNKLDLCLFCHTFSTADYANRDRISDEIMLIANEQLNSSGTLTFLLPDVSPDHDFYAKVMLMDFIAERLLKAGMKTVKHEKDDLRPLKNSWAKSQKQNLVMETRRVINRNCLDSSIITPFNDSNEMDRPYYSLSSRIDIFYW